MTISGKLREAQQKSHSMHGSSEFVFFLIPPAGSVVVVAVVLVWLAAVAATLSSMVGFEDVVKPFIHVDKRIYLCCYHQQEQWP